MRNRWHVRELEQSTRRSDHLLKGFMLCRHSACRIFVGEKIIARTADVIEPSLRRFRQRSAQRDIPIQMRTRTKADMPNSTVLLTDDSRKGRHNNICRHIPNEAIQIGRIKHGQQRFTVITVDAFSINSAQRNALFLGCVPD